MRRVAAALVHHPVLDRGGEIVTTAITNLDLHDLARSAHCYGLSDLFVAHPIAAQRELALRVRTHWTEGSGARRIPDRKPALEMLRIVENLEEVVSALGGPSAVELWTTGARVRDRSALAFGEARQRLGAEGPTVLLVFGTGWGLAPAVDEGAQFRLAPIESPRSDGFNHLSVRAAAAIVFDRLLGDRPLGDRPLGDRPLGDRPAC
jgi:hypothetical protein